MAEKDKAIEAPEGWDIVDTDLDDYDAVKWDVTPLFTGTVIKIKETTVRRRNGDERETRFMVVADDQGQTFNLWENANLEQLFDAAVPEMKVWVHFTGFSDLSEGRKMRKFDARYKLPV